MELLEYLDQQPLPVEKVQTEIMLNTDKFFQTIASWMVENFKKGMTVREARMALQKWEAKSIEVQQGNPRLTMIVDMPRTAYRALFEVLAEIYNNDSDALDLITVDLQSEAKAALKKRFVYNREVIYHVLEKAQKPVS